MEFGWEKEYVSYGCEGYRYFGDKRSVLRGIKGNQSNGAKLKEDSLEFYIRYKFLNRDVFIRV